MTNINVEKLIADLNNAQYKIDDDDNVPYIFREGHEQPVSDYKWRTLNDGAFTRKDGLHPTLEQPVSGGVDELLIRRMIYEEVAKVRDGKGYIYGDAEIMDNIMDKIRPYLKQPAPPDETLREALEHSNTVLQHAVRYIDCYTKRKSEVIISHIYEAIARNQQALSQPPKTAMRKNDAIIVVMQALYKASGNKMEWGDFMLWCVQNQRDADLRYREKAVQVITALEAAGVLNVRKE